MQELLRHAPGSKVTMERYGHVTAGQQRDAAEMLERALTATLTVTESVEGVVPSRAESPEVGDPQGEGGSGGRIRTYDQAVNSRPLYH